MLVLTVPCIVLQSVLGYEVRKPGAAHNCLDDACAAMKLVLAKLDHGDIRLVQEDVWTCDCGSSLFSTAYDYRLCILISLN